VVAYRVAWSVAVSLGDPVGPRDELEHLLESFVSFCAGRGWRVAFQEVLPDLLPVYRRLGFRVQ
jgi:phosphatidylglycerol lysyltransferase